MPTESKQATGARTITASKFKAKCMELLDEVVESGEEIVITKNGHPVSRLVPYREQSSGFIGRDRDKIRILGDIVSPMPAEWFEDSEDVDKDLF